MESPFGYRVQGESSSQKLVCKLHKSISRLKQASRQWNSKFIAALIQFGLSKSKFDYSLFVKGSSSTFVTLLVYVDDIVITGPSLDLIATLKTFLHSKFKLKKLGPLKYFLGLEIARATTGIVIVLSQRHYTLQLLEDTGFLATKPISVPMDPKVRLTAHEGELLSLNIECSLDG